MKTAVILFNLGGPRDLREVRGFLFRLFADPAILPLPAPLRLPLAALIALLRKKKATEIYRAIGGGSPLLGYTEEQAHALERILGSDFRCFISMRYAARFKKSFGVSGFRGFGADKPRTFATTPPRNRAT
ncbi:MAG: ferrochelatase [Proteobacteria bacterium]|nr:ferrochelatase [Pseudomonadota bacterium]